MKRKILCTSLAFMLMCSTTACDSTSNTQSKADKMSNKTPPYSSLSASNEANIIQDNTALEFPNGNADNSTYEPYSTTACGSTSNTQSEAEKISSKTPPYSSLSTSNKANIVQDNTALESPDGNADNSAYEPYSTTVCGSTPNTQPKVDKISSKSPPYSSLSASNEANVVQDNTALESPNGNVDYSVYEPYGLLYDSQNNCYTFNGNIVRYFNDTVVGASFTNYFTGTVDIEAEYDTKNVLVGIKECSQEVYDYHNKKQTAFSTGGKTNKTIQSGTQQSSDTHWLKDYEIYGISYDTKKSCWYCNDERIKILIDNEKKLVYSTDENGICLSVVRNEDHTIAKIKEIAEADAKDLMQRNNPQDNGDLTIED